MKDECDKIIRPEIIPIYEALRAKAIAEYRKSGATKSLYFTDYARVDGRKVTCMFYISKSQGFRNENPRVTEQFEYYDYMYDSMKYGPTVEEFLKNT